MAFIKGAGLAKTGDLVQDTQQGLNTDTYPQDNFLGQVDSQTGPVPTEQAHLPGFGGGIMGLVEVSQPDLANAFSDSHVARSFVTSGAVTAHHSS
jgi:hypothetical protein